MDITKVCVVGAGAMGNGIAQVIATAGYRVYVRDVDGKFLDRCQKTIQKSLDRFVKGGKLTEQQTAQIMGRINLTTSLDEGVSDAQIIIEAVPENMDIKKQVLTEIDGIAMPEAIIASNTSQFSITALGALTKRADKVIGMHWFNPAPIMKLIEIAVGVETSPETLEILRDFSHSVGKETVACRDSQGFITTRALVAFEAECSRILEEGVASREDIDKAIHLGLGHPMGPFQVADLSGLDVTLDCAEALTQAFGDRFRPSQTLRNKVRAGHFGKKTNIGYYTYKK